jgi:hypothetical protein
MATESSGGRFIEKKRGVRRQAGRKARVAQLPAQWSARHDRLDWHFWMDTGTHEHGVTVRPKMQEAVQTAESILIGRKDEHERCKYKFLS